MNEPPARLVSALEDRYLVVRELGEGGMATVYLAHDVRHDRRVALEVEVALNWVEELRRKTQGVGVER